MRERRAFRLEVEWDEAMLTDLTKDMVEKLILKTGLQLRAKCVMLANPDVLHVEFQEWHANGGFKDVPVPEDPE